MAQSPEKPAAHVFVVTYGRSGSTVLTRLLNEIDGYCIRGENGGVIRTLANSFRVLNSTWQFAGHYEDGEDSPWFGFRQVDPDEWRQRLARDFVDVVLKPPPGTRVTGFKEVRYTSEEMDHSLFAATIDFLATAFENSRIIFNTRDGTQVAKSGWWAEEYLPAHVHEIVATADRRFREAHARLGPERSFMIDYADYNGKPQGFLPLLEWLGEELPWERVQAISAERLMHMKDEITPGSSVSRWITSMISEDGPFAGRPKLEFKRSLVRRVFSLKSWQRLAKRVSS
jgi:hypothetical protein